MAKEIKDAKPPIVSRDRSPSFGAFVVRLFVYLFAVSLLFSLAGLHTRLQPLQWAIAFLATTGANLLGAGARVNGAIIDVTHLKLEINHECTAIFVLLVYAAFVLAYPATWAKRFSGVAVGAAVLMAVNVGRLVVLTLIASSRPSWFPYLHEYFFQGMFIALLAFLASVWTEQVRRATVSNLAR